MGIAVVAHAPFIFVYTLSLTTPDFKFSFKNFYHFAFIGLAILAFLPYFTLSPEARLDAVHQQENLSYYVLLPMLTLIFIRIYFLTRTFIVLTKHQYSIKQAYSYVAKINLAWIKMIVLAYLALIVLSFVGYGLASAQIISVFWMDYALILANIVLFFFLAYRGFKQSAIQAPIPSVVASKKNQPVKSAGNIESKANDKDHAESVRPKIKELLKLMEKERLYLDHELHIGNVANQLNIPAHQLSKLLNNQLNKNFFEFVNEYRIKEFKMLAADPKNKHISILGLAMDAGFNSKATFNRIFKNTTGQTPSQFRDNYNF